jgi:hypothetical protein
MKKMNMSTHEAVVLVLLLLAVSLAWYAFLGWALAALVNVVFGTDFDWFQGFAFVVALSIVRSVLTPDKVD